MDKASRDRAKRLRKIIGSLQTELDSLETGIYHIYADHPFPEIEDPDGIEEIILHGLGEIDRIEFSKKAITLWCGIHRFALGLAEGSNNMEFAIQVKES